MRQTIKSFIQSITSFFGQEKGTAAVEFALIAPLMITTFIGTVEISHAWLTKEKIEAATETVADLVSQGQSTTPNDLNQILSITNATLNTNEEAAINIVISALRTEPNDDGDPETKVKWSHSKTGAGVRAVCAIYEDLPEDLAANYETIILTELKYSYTSILGNLVSASERFIMTASVFDRAYLNRPRYSSDIPCEDCGECAD